MAPTFSIIIPTYNQADYLAEALESILAQTTDDWEAVVVNDGSTDHTQMVLQQFAGQDKRIKIFHKPNGGTASALNYALANASGQWICWLSSDDLFKPDKLAIHKQWIDNHPEVKFFFTYFSMLFESSGQKVEHHPLWGPLLPRAYQTLALFKRNFISGISICAHHSVFKELGFFDESLRYAQDYDRWLWITSRYPGMLIPQWTVINRNHAGQGSEVFPQACYYDTAKSAINFIKRNKFSQMLPLLDTNSYEGALNALIMALDVAADADSFLYYFGLNPSLLFCIYEWLNEVSLPEGEIQGLWNYLETEAGSNMWKYHGQFAAMWRNAYLVARTRPARVDRQDIKPELAGQSFYCSLSAYNPAHMEPCRQYFDLYMPNAQLYLPSSNLCDVSVNLKCPFSADSDVKELMYQVGQILALNGAAVLLVQNDESSISFADNITMLSLPEENMWQEAATDIRAFDVVITWQKTASGKSKLVFHRADGEHSLLLSDNDDYTMVIPDEKNILAACSPSSWAKPLATMPGISRRVLARLRNFFNH